MPVELLADDVGRRVASIVRDVFNEPGLHVTRTTGPAEVMLWDSLNHMNLIMRLEEEFGVSFTTRQIGTLLSVGDLVDFLRHNRT